MSDAFSWSQVDESVHLHCCPDAHTHTIYYYRKYTINRGYAHSRTNDLISNFQKGPNVPQNILRYREGAINKFVEELSELVAKFKREYDFYIVPTPPSSLKENPEYDPRVEEVAQRLVHKFPHIKVASCMVTTIDIGKSKSNREGRSWERIYDTLEVDPTKLPPDTSNTVILILDDVLTSGSHFEAIRRKLREHLQSTEIAGLYWARAVNPDAIEQG